MHISASWWSKLDWSEAARTLFCMMPMVGAYALGYPSLGVPMGQAGFFLAAQPLARLPFFRLTTGLLFLTIGLGFYLIGGAVVFTYPVALGYTFLVSMGLALMSGWRLAALLAFSFFSVYSAGLNSTSPERVTTNFFAFALAILWGTLVSLPKWWRGVELPVFSKPTLKIRFETGVRMGVATTLSLAIADYYHYSKLGWAPSAAASVIRFETDVSKKRALIRVIGTVIGAVVVFLVFMLVDNQLFWVLIALLAAAANGLTVRINSLGFLPFYTTVVLILYSLNDPSMTTQLAAERMWYNVVGVLVATGAVVYSFPYLQKWDRRWSAFAAEFEEAERVMEGSG